MRGACLVSLLRLASALAGPREAGAACINVTTGLPVSVSQPTSNQTVVCDTSAPNPPPPSTVISAAAGSTNVSVTVLPGSILSPTVRAIGIVTDSTALNQGLIHTSG